MAASDDGRADADPHPTPETVDRALVAAVVPHVELRDVRLDWCHAAVNCLRSDVPDDWHGGASVHADTHFAGESHERENAFTAYAFIELTWDHRPDVVLSGAEGIGDAEIDVVLRAIYALDYTLSDEVMFDDVTLEHFCVFNGTFNAWPYWREFVQSTTMRLGLNPLVMPVMKITSGSAQRQRAEKTST
jgi:hypothetical protein